MSAPSGSADCFSARETEPNRRFLNLISEMAAVQPYKVGHPETLMKTSVELGSDMRTTKSESTYPPT